MADLVDNNGVYVICYELRINFCDISLKAATVLWLWQIRQLHLKGLKRSAVVVWKDDHEQENQLLWEYYESRGERIVCLAENKYVGLCRKNWLRENKNDEQRAWSALIIN